MSPLQKQGFRAKKLDSRLRGNDKHCFRSFAFLLAAFRRRPKAAPPIIERTCAFDAKIYKIVDAVFDVSACCGGNKKIF